MNELHEELVAKEKRGSTFTEVGENHVTFVCSKLHVSK